MARACVRDQMDIGRRKYIMGIFMMVLSREGCVWMWVLS